MRRIRRIVRSCHYSHKNAVSASGSLQGTDIGQCVAFEIHEDYFYAVSTQPISVDESKYITARASLLDTNEDVDSVQERDLLL